MVVVQPELQSIIRTVEAPGDVEAVFEVEIRSEIPAKIEEMPVQEGDTVKTGQLLCRLNDDEYRALVESGEASAARLGSVIRQAEADLEKSRRDWARQQELAERHATSNIELADYRTLLVKSEVAVEATKHQLAESEAMLRRARENLKKTIITSPIDGVISKVQAKAGEIVVTGTMNNPGTSIMRITDMSRMQVKARVDETDVPLVRPEQPVNIFVPSEPDRPIPGWVLRVATAGSKPAGRDVVTFETLVMVETNDGSVKPGMTANVEIQVDRKDNVLTVPVQAVVHRKRKELPEELVAEYERRQAELGLVERQNRAQYMTVVFSKDDDKARPHLVRTGIADEARVELVEASVRTMSSSSAPTGAWTSSRTAAPSRSRSPSKAPRQPRRRRCWRTSRKAPSALKRMIRRSPRANDPAPRPHLDRPPEGPAAGVTPAAAPGALVADARVPRGGLGPPE